VSRVHDAWTGLRARVHGGLSSGADFHAMHVTDAMRAKCCGLQSSPIEVEEGEDDLAVPMRGSPGHGWWRRSSATTMEDGGGSFT
jgi:hypothetical protein